MWYHVIACDYDGTLASEGRISPATLRALARVRDSGRRIVLITGRQFDDLLRVCPEIDFFDWVVAENGAVLYEPRGKRVDDLADPAPPAFLAALERARVPFSTGRVIVSTVVPHETAVLRAIHDLGLELQVIFNRESVMVLPAAVSKQSGLEEVLRRVGVPAHNVIGVGDAENDRAFLRLAGFAVAVGNAVPSLAAEADLVTRAPNGAGVREFVEERLLAGREPFRPRNLETFSRLAEGVDDATWLHHLGRGDVSRWLREVIKDDVLADEVQALERSGDAAATRRAVLEAIARRYTPAARRPSDGGDES